MSSDIERYAAHVEALLLEHGVEVDWRESTRPRSWRKTRRVRLQPVRSAATYAVALHEIGHVVGPQSGRRLDKEAQAWRWAEAAALEWREPMLRTAARCVASYLRACERRRTLWTPPADHDSRRIAEWA